MDSNDKADGDAGCRRATAMLSVALCAEVSISTLREDSSKVDMKLTFRNTFNEGSTLVVHCQVKSGKSYFYPSQSGRDIITLRNIDEATIKALQKGTPLALVIWVPPPPSERVFWHIVRSAEKQGCPIKIRRTDSVTPSLQIDLSRYHEFLQRKGAPQIHLSAASGSDKLKEMAKVAYKALQQKNPIGPLTGEVKISRAGWRHVTRRSRSTEKRERSFRLIPHLGKFLERNPTRYLVSPIRKERKGNQVEEEREIILWFENSLVADGRSWTVLIRIREQVRFPSQWFRQPLSTRDIDVTRTLVGWWYKPANEKTEKKRKKKKDSTLVVPTDIAH